jgi:hypothetical protein
MEKIMKPGKLEILERELIKLVAIEINLLRIALPILGAVLALQVYALVQGIVIL